MSDHDGRVWPSDALTSRERLLAAYRGRQVDRLPFWAKVANATWQSSQPEPVRTWSARELLDFIGADGLFGVGRVVQRTAPRVRTETADGGNARTVVSHTPDGPLTSRWALDPYTQSWHPVEFPVKDRPDIARYRWLFADIRYELDEPALDRARRHAAAVGPRGLTVCWTGTSPLMDLVEHVIGPAQVHLMLADYGDELDELMALMHADRLAGLRATAAHTPADMLVSGENTSTTLISPRQFRRYCHRHLCDYGQVIHAAGKMHELHMCGHLKALLDDIETIPAESIEAFTAPTLGNTRLADGRTRAPSKTLVGGTHVGVWLWDLPRIERYIADELAACPDRRRIVLTTAGVAPPGAPAETFRAVGNWLRTLQQ